jgi:hypothetical protein
LFRCCHNIFSPLLFIFENKNLPQIFFNMLNLNFLKYFFINIFSHTQIFF